MRMPAAVRAQDWSPVWTSRQRSAAGFVSSLLADFFPAFAFAPELSTHIGGVPMLELKLLNVVVLVSMKGK